MQLSVTKKLKYDDCPRQYMYQYEMRLEPVAQSANLVFGKAIDHATTVYLVALGKGDDGVDPERVFVKDFEERLSRNEVTFTGHDRDALEQIGRVLMRQFPAYWESTGLLVATDRRGEPIVQRRLLMDLGSGLTVVIIPDVVAVNLAGQTHVLDVKATASPATEGFAMVSEQLLTYRLGVSVHAENLGIEMPSWTGFVEGVKKAIPKTAKGTPPHWAPLSLAPCNANLSLRDLVQDYHQVAHDIQSRRFPRRPRMAWNTPCDLCDFRKLCFEGSMEGLREREPFKAAA